MDSPTSLFFTTAVVRRKPEPSDRTARNVRRIVHHFCVGAVAAFWGFLLVVVLLEAGAWAALEVFGLLILILGGWIIIGLLLGGAPSGSPRDYGHPGSTSFWDGDGV